MVKIKSYGGLLKKGGLQPLSPFSATYMYAYLPIQAILDAHGSWAHIKVMCIASLLLDPLLNIKNNSYYTRLYVHQTYQNVLLQIKIWQMYL